MSSGGRLPASDFLPGASFMPENFPERLTALKETSRLSWEGLATCIGVDIKQVQRWRQGAEPCGGAMLSLVRLATLVPEGLGKLLGDDRIVVYRRN